MNPNAMPNLHPSDQFEQANFAWPGNSARQPIDPNLADTLATVLASVADPSRMRVLSLMAAHEPRPMSVTEVTEALGCAQSTASHHLKVLVAAGLVQVEHTGNWRLYRANAERLEHLLSQFMPGQ